MASSTATRQKLLFFSSSASRNITREFPQVGLELVGTGSLSSSSQSSCSSRSSRRHHLLLARQRHPAVDEAAIISFPPSELLSPKPSFTSKQSTDLPTLPSAPRLVFKQSEPVIRLVPYDPRIKADMSDSTSQQFGRSEVVDTTSDGAVSGNESVSPVYSFDQPIENSGNHSGPETRLLVPQIAIQPTSDKGDDDKLSPVLSPTFTRRPLPSPILYRELLEVPRRYYTQQERNSFTRPRGLDTFPQQNARWSRYQIFSPTRPRSDYFDQEDGIRSQHRREQGLPSLQGRISSPPRPVGSGLVQQGDSSSQLRGEPRPIIYRAIGPPVFPQEQSLTPRRGNFAQQESRLSQNRNEGDPFVSQSSTEHGPFISQGVNSTQHRQGFGNLYQQDGIPSRTQRLPITPQQGSSSEKQSGYGPPIRPQGGSSQHHRQYWHAIPQEDRPSHHGTGFGTFGQQDGSSPQRRGGYRSSIPRSRSSQLPRGSSSVVQQQISSSQSFGGFRPPIPPDGRSRHPLVFGNLYQQDNLPQLGEDIPPVPRLSRSQYRSFENLVLQQRRGLPQHDKADQPLVPRQADSSNPHRFGRLIRRQQSLPQFGTEHRPFIAQKNDPQHPQRFAHRQSNSPRQGRAEGPLISQQGGSSQPQESIHQQSSLPQHGREDRRIQPQGSAQNHPGFTHQQSNPPESGTEDGFLIPQQGNSQHPRAFGNSTHQ